MLGVESSGCLGRERRLADAGFPGHQHDLKPPLGRRSLLRFLQHLQLDDPSGESEEPTARVLGQPGGERDSTARVGHHVVGFPEDLDGRYRSGEALELEIADRGERLRRMTAHSQPQELGGQDLSALGQRAQARASTTGSPKKPPSSSVASPVASPMRTPSGVSDRRLCRSIPWSISTPHATARLGLEKTTMSPSPRFLTSRPPIASIDARSIPKCRSRSASASTAVSRGELGGPDQVGEQEGRGDALAHLHPPSWNHVKASRGQPQMLGGSDSLGWPTAPACPCIGDGGPQRRRPRRHDAPRRADEDQLLVRVPGHRPAAAVHASMVMEAQEGQVVDVGTPAGLPVPDVMGVRERRIGTSGEAAVPIPPPDLPALGLRRVTPGPTLVHRVAHVVVDGNDDVRRRTRSAGPSRR